MGRRLGYCTFVAMKVQAHSFLQECARMQRVSAVTLRRVERVQCRVFRRLVFRESSNDARLFHQKKNR